jgi:hypothetical protein
VKEYNFTCVVCTVIRGSIWLTLGTLFALSRGRLLIIGQHLLCTNIATQKNRKHKFDSTHGKFQTYFIFQGITWSIIALRNWLVTFSNPAYLHLSTSSFSRFSHLQMGEVTLYVSHNHHDRGMILQVLISL